MMGTDYGLLFWLLVFALGPSIAIALIAGWANRR